MLLFSIVINVYLLRNGSVLDGWSDSKMIDFAQYVTNYEVTKYDLDRWIESKNTKL